MGYKRKSWSNIFLKNYTVNFYLYFIMRSYRGMEKSYWIVKNLFLFSEKNYSYLVSLHILYKKNTLSIFYFILTRKIMKTPKRGHI